MRTKILLLLFLFAVVVNLCYAEDKSKQEGYCFKCRIDELTKEDNKLEQLIQQAQNRRWYIKGAIEELRKMEQENALEKGKNENTNN